MFFIVNHEVLSISSIESVSYDKLTLHNGRTFSLDDCANGVKYNKFLNDVIFKYQPHIEEFNLRENTAVWILEECEPCKEKN